MDILDFLENMGFGISVVFVFVVIILLIMVAGMIFPVLLNFLGGLLFLLIIIIAVGALVYFIGKFTKDFIKK